MPQSRHTVCIADYDVTLGDGMDVGCHNSQTTRLPRVGRTVLSLSSGNGAWWTDAHQTTTGLDRTTSLTLKKKQWKLICHFFLRKSLFRSIKTRAVFFTVTLPIVLPIHSFPNIRRTFKMFTTYQQTVPNNPFRNQSINLHKIWKNPSSIPTNQHTLYYCFDEYTTE